MKIPVFLLAMASLVPAQTAAPQTPPSPPKAAAPTLLPGSTVTLDALSKLEWVQGEGPKAWEPGKVYVFECWATWCGPCVAAIPHVNELHKKYQDKGLRVFGINVWEDGKDKVEKFVKGKGDGMSYPVAYTGKGGAFETEWLKPAGVKGIPHTFVVKDGKLILAAHPNSLTDKVIEALLSGEDGLKKAQAELDAQGAQKAKYNEAARAFMTAKRSNDAEAMTARYAEMKELGGDDVRLIGYGIQLALTKKDWPQAEALLTSIPDSMLKAMVLQQAAQAVDEAAEAPEGLVKKTVEAFAPIAAKVSGPVDSQVLAQLQWRAGDKAGAIASMKAAAENAADPRNARMGFSAEPYQKIVAAMEGGTMPDKSVTAEWFREATEKRMKEQKEPEKQ